MHVTQSFSTTAKRRTAALFLLLLLFAVPQVAQAHVKWFTDFQFSDPPRTLREIITPTFFALAGLSMAVIGGMVILERRLRGVAWYERINAWFSARSNQSYLIMRVAIAATLLLSWQADSLLAPELSVPAAWVGWFQFLLAALLITDRTTPAAGAGLFVLYVLGVAEYGFFHLIDYVHYLGIGFYLLVGNDRRPNIRELGLPALFASVGFSLAWLGLEKLVYPQWALYLLQENPQLALGLNPDFFRVGAAFVEISLGYLLVIGLLERPLSLVITLVFFTTTLIFGKVEIIGHTPIHAALLVFLLNGPGTVYRPPIALHQRLNWRVAFGVVNFALFLLLIALGYTTTARAQYNQAQAAMTADHSMGMMLEIGDLPNVPRFETVEVVGEMGNLYNLHVELTNWTWTPELTGAPTVPGEGHAHIYLNGEKIGRMYSDWYHLGELPPGEYEVVIDLNGNDHTMFHVNGVPLTGRTTFTVEP